MIQEPYPSILHWNGQKCGSQKKVTFGALPPKLPSHHELNVIINKNMNQENLASFYHGCCFSPTKRTFTQAIAIFFATWPGLTSKLVNYMTEKEATALEHLKQESQGLQSTKELNPPQKSNDLFVMVTQPADKNKGYSNLTCKFPITLSRGTKYLLVTYAYNMNAILV